MSQTVSLPDDLYEQCNRTISGTEFESVDEYVQFVLSEVLAADVGASPNNAARPDVDEDHLEALGYLDR